MSPSKKTLISNKVYIESKLPKEVLRNLKRINFTNKQIRSLIDDELVNYANRNLYMFESKSGQLKRLFDVNFKNMNRKTVALLMGNTNNVKNNIALLPTKSSAYRSPPRLPTKSSAYRPPPRLPTKSSAYRSPPRLPTTSSAYRPPPPSLARPSTANYRPRFSINYTDPTRATRASKLRARSRAPPLYSRRPQSKANQYLKHKMITAPLSLRIGNIHKPVPGRGRSLPRVF